MKERKTLFAGLETDGYEYAVWAKNRQSISSIFSPAAKDRLINQSTNKALKELCPDQTKIYRRKLDSDDEWRVWRDA